jgi:hypothetical protein
MNKYILGSGLIAFLAKKIHPEFEILPVGKSRFYQYDVATCDDYIFCHDDVDPIIDQITGGGTIPVLFRRAINAYGQLLYGKHEWIVDWLKKTYRGDYNPAAKQIISMEGFVYKHACTDLFKILEPQMKKEFRHFIESNNKIKSINVEDHLIYTNNEVLEFDKMISTVPLDYLCKLAGEDQDLQTLDLHTCVVDSKEIDFEGSTELLIIDENIAFFKCTRIGPKSYQFYSNEEIPDLRGHLNLMINKYDLISGTCVKNAIPLGNPKSIPQFADIFCVGSHAQWDDFMDVSSCIRRLCRYNAQ